MLLGYEWEILSKISCTYQLHVDGTYQFSKHHYTTTFPEDTEMVYLNKLAEIGLCEINSNLVKVFSTRWVKLFFEEFRTTLSMMGYNVSALRIDGADSIQMSLGQEISVNIQLSLSPSQHVLSHDVIYFWHSETFDFNLYWLDLINDRNQAEILYFYLTKRLSSVAASNAFDLNFFDGLDASQISDIYHNTVGSYFDKLGYEHVNMEHDVTQKVYSYIRQEDYEQYQMAKFATNLVIVRLDRKIIILPFEDGDITYSSTLRSMLDQLRQQLIKLVGEYRQLTRLNDMRAFSTTKEIVQFVVLYFVTPLDLLFFAGTFFNSNFAKLWYIKLALATIIILILVIVWRLFIWPFIKLMRFKWDL